MRLIGTVAFQQQDPGEAAHQHTDPKRHQHGEEQDGTARLNGGKPRQGKSDDDSRRSAPSTVTIPRVRPRCYRIPADRPAHPARRHVGGDTGRPARRTLVTARRKSGSRKAQPSNSTAGSNNNAVASRAARGFTACDPAGSRAPRYGRVHGTHPAAGMGGWSHIGRDS